MKDVLYILTGLVTILVGAFGAYKYGYIRGYKEAKSKLRQQILEKRHALIYEVLKE